jgi:hypothetical protein
MADRLSVTTGVTTRGIAPGRHTLQRMCRRGQSIRLAGAAVATVAILLVLAGCAGEPRRSPTPMAAQDHVFYAQVAAYIGPDGWARAERQAQVVRAKGFPAAVYSSHTEFPSHTLYAFVAVASGQFPTMHQAQAQVERLRDAGFTAAKVLVIALPR